MKPQMLLKWDDEQTARPISRDDAARNIRKNRQAPRELRIVVKRMHGETYICSRFLGVACCIFKKGNAQ